MILILAAFFISLLSELITVSIIIVMYSTPLSVSNRTINNAFPSNDLSSFFEPGLMDLGCQAKNFSESS